jgi:hypothetical protein
MARGASIFESGSKLAHVALDAACLEAPRGLGAHVKRLLDDHLLGVVEQELAGSG